LIIAKLEAGREPSAVWVAMRLSRLLRASVFYILDRILEEYPEDFEAWLAEYEGAKE